MTRKFLPILRLAQPIKYFIIALLALSSALTYQQASAQSPTDPIDQQQDRGTIGQPIDTAFAQTFVPTVDNLSGVGLSLEGNGTVRISIHANHPSGPELAATTIAAQSDPDFAPFSPTLSLTPGNTYAINVTKVSGSVNITYISVQNSDFYPNGTGWIFFQGNWNAFGAGDLLFSTHYIAPDADGDGIPDLDDNCPANANPGQENFDSDAQGDACDPDDDNDGVNDINDAFPLDPSETADSDSDTVGDNSDNCPADANPGQENFDGDAQGDACDPDDDNDGQTDAEEIDCGSDPLDASSMCVTETVAYTCGGYDVLVDDQGNYSAPDFAGTLIIGTNRRNTIHGTSGDDLILGLKGSDEIHGKQGNDVICGGKGHDWIHGHMGNDTIYGEQGWDDLIGHHGDDELFGGGGYDVLLGGHDNDTLWGEDSRDDLYGQRGDDDLDGGNGRDFCRGNRGADTIANCEGASAAAVDSPADADSTDIAEASPDDTLSIEELDLLSENDMNEQIFVPFVSQ